MASAKRNLVLLFLCSLSFTVLHLVHSQNASFSNDSYQDIYVEKMQDQNMDNEKIYEGIEVESNYLPSKVFSKNMSFWVILLFAFLYGILISLTPCVYPMIPITAAIVQSQASSAVIYNFLLSFTYVLGTAVSYATLGLVVALSGGIFGYWLSSPWFILFIMLFLLYLAGSMFGWYEIYMPKLLTRRTSVKTKGKFVYAFIAGVVSGTVASPCISPALAALLLYVAEMANPILGFVTLFTFALGMGMLLLVVGTSSSMINLIPSAGMWMVEVKKIFGFLLVGVCIYYLSNIIPDIYAMFIFNLFLLTIAFYYLITGMKRHFKIIKIIAGVTLLIIGLSTTAESIMILHNKSLIDYIFQQ